EAGAVFARAADDVDGAFFKLAIELEDVIARNAEDVLQSIVLQAANEILADRQRFGASRRMVRRRDRGRNRFQARHAIYPHRRATLLAHHHKDTRWAILR